MQAFNCREKKWEYVDPATLTDEEIAELQEQADRDAERAKVLERTRPLSLGEVQEMMVRQQINTLAVDDATALRMVAYYPEWAAGTAYAAGDRVVYNGALYKCVQAHTSQADWTPDATPAIWVVVSIEEYPEWVQPTGAHDAYNTGDKVSYHGKHYICTADANIYAPDVYGWEET